MNRTSGKILAGLSIALMGFGFPAILVYLAAFYALNIWFVGIFTFLSLLGAVAVTGIVLGITTYGIGDDDEDFEDRYNQLMQAMARLVDRFNKIQSDLKEIDEILKVEE